MDRFVNVDPAGATTATSWIASMLMSLPLAGWLFAGAREFQDLKTEVINTRIKVGKLEGKMEVLLSTMKRVEVNMTTHNASSDRGMIKQAGNEINE